MWAVSLSSFLRGRFACNLARKDCCIYWQPGFPTAGSQPIEQSSLLRGAWNRTDLQFADVESLNASAALSS